MKNIIFLSFLFFSSLFGLDNEYPVVILGSGIGGLTSSLYLGQAKVKSLVIEGKVPGGRLTEVARIVNWPGEKTISGNDLVQKIRGQIDEKYTDFLDGDIIGIDLSQRPFKIQVQTGATTKTILAQTCIVAMGTQLKHLNVKGESGKEGYAGRGVSYCAICDGSFFKDKIVAVVGGGDSALSEADYLSRLAKKVYVVMRKDTFSTTKSDLSLQDNVEIVSKAQVQEIIGDGEKVTALSLEGFQGQTLPVDGVFVSIGSIPNTQIFQGKLDMNPAGYIQVKEEQKTSVLGVFAVGDICRPGEKQALFAAADGAKAAISALHYLKKEKVTNVSNVKKSAPSFVGVMDVSTKTQWDEQVTKTTMPVVVDFYAPWCGPCRRVLPAFKNCADKKSQFVKFITVNIDKDDVLSSMYQVRSIPTFLLFNAKGELVARRMGMDDVLAVLSRIEKFQSEDDAASFFKELK
jgi:thioredoxin reductase (NADPH)